jgi:hypothetical protein
LSNCYQYSKATWSPCWQLQKK